MLQSAAKTWKWWLSSKISAVTLEWSFQIFQTHLERRKHFKKMKLKTIKNVMYTMRRRIWVGLILSLFAEGHQLGGWRGGSGDLSLVCFSFPLFAHYGDVTEIYNKGVRSLDVFPNTGLFEFSLHHHVSAVSTDDGDDIHSTIRRRVRSNNFRSNAFLKKRSNHTHIECWGRENR